MQDVFSFQDKVILITGAGRGIGRAIAETFRDRGAVVYGTGSRESSLEAMQVMKIERRIAAALHERGSDLEGNGSGWDKLIVPFT